MKEKQTTGGTEGEGEERQVKEKKILLRRYWSRDDSPTDTVRERLIASVWRAFERGLTRVKLWSGAFARRFDGSGARPKVAEKKMAVRRQKELQRTILRGLRRAEIKSYHGKELICPSLCLFLFRCLLSFPYDSFPFFTTLFSSCPSFSPGSITGDELSLFPLLSSPLHCENGNI